MKSYEICLSLTYSFSTIPSRSIHVVADDNISFFFMAVIFHCMYASLILYPLIY